jgi:hypothetical protein
MHFALPKLCSPGPLGIGSDFVLVERRRLMTVVVGLLCILLTTLLPTFLFPLPSDARCPNVYHNSPDGFHRSHDGDCERISLGSNGTESGDDYDEDGDKKDNNDETLFINTIAIKAQGA